jgi:hypothetical protein
MITITLTPLSLVATSYLSLLLVRNRRASLDRTAGGGGPHMSIWLT